MFELICMGAAGLLAGGVIGASLAAWHLYREQEKPVKLLTAGHSVKYHGRVWEIKRFMTDSENQTVAVLESQGDGEIILRRTMAAVEELEVVE